MPGRCSVKSRAPWYSAELVPVAASMSSSASRRASVPELLSSSRRDSRHAAPNIPAMSVRGPGAIV
ncbi:MAG: hypothetical protein WDM81_13570 [Rhizomicrobium sp.]